MAPARSRPSANRPETASHAGTPSLIAQLPTSQAIVSRLHLCIRGRRSENKAFSTRNAGLRGRGSKTGACSQARQGRELSWRGACGPCLRCKTCRGRLPPPGAVFPSGWTNFGKRIEHNNHFKDFPSAATGTYRTGGEAHATATVRKQVIVRRRTQQR